MKIYTQWIHTCEIGGAYHVAQQTSSTPLDKQGQLFGNCLDSRALQTRRCKRPPESLQFLELACTCKYPGALSSSLPGDPQHKHSYNHFICFKNNKIRLSLNKNTHKFNPEFNIARIVVIIFFLWESGHSPFQQCGEVAFFPSLRESLLCPLNIPVKKKKKTESFQN